MATFQERYNELEEEMRKMAREEGSVFLPNIPPVGPCHYMLVCMEPSLGHWARTPQEAEAKVCDGFRNFLYSQEDFILHYCAHTFLKGFYHLTDISKGAMSIKDAQQGREARWKKWEPLLRKELELLGNPITIAVGKSKVFPFLHRSQLTEHCVPHYAWSNSRWIKQAYDKDYKDYPLGSIKGVENELQGFVEQLLNQVNFTDNLRNERERLRSLFDRDLPEWKKKLFIIYREKFLKINEQNR